MPEPRFQQAVTAFQNQKFDQAMALCTDLLADQPDHLPALNLQAVLWCRRGQFDPATDACLHILQIDPDHAAALELLGDILHALHEYAGAAEAFRRAATPSPHAARLTHKEAAALHLAGQPAAAVALYLDLLRTGTTSGAVIADLTTALRELPPALALSRLRHAIADSGASQPQALGWLHRLLAEILTSTGQITEAITAWKLAVRYRPQDADGLYNLARLLQEREQHEEALGLLEQAITFAPNHPEALSNRSAALLACGRPADAVASARAALAVRPDYAMALCNLGAALQEDNQPQAAEQALRQAHALQPEQIEILCSLAVCLLALGQQDDALALLRQAEHLAPHHPEIRFNFALALLRSGEYALGWRLYGWRKRRASHSSPAPRYPTLLPDAFPVSGARLLITPEQGIGDEIMFAGLLPAVQARGQAVALHCDPRLQSLLQRSFPDLTILSATDQPPADVAVECACGDLPGLLGLHGQQAAWLPEQFLRCDDARRDALRQQYGGQRRIGLSWATSSRRTGTRRSIPPALLASLADGETDATAFVSLQYGDPARLADAIGPAVHVDPAIDQMSDLDAFAAQVAAMDLVITIDNSTAHMAAALGVPTWLLLPFDADWRWQLPGGQWYPTMRMFRQSSAGDWQPVIAEVKAALKTFPSQARVSIRGGTIPGI